jgi:uncharacterized protein involved in exopolysaccharide biosynthesis
METSQINFSLKELMSIGLKWKKQIIVFAVLVSVITAVYAYSLKNQFTSYANFYPSNGIIASRDNMFRTEFQDAIDQFGLENESDRLYSVGNSSPLISELISKYKMDEHYDIDIKNDPKGNLKLYKKFDKNFQVSKGAFGNLELTFTDWDTKLAAAVANDALISLQDKIRAYYVNSAKGIAEALDVKMKFQDSVIHILTDSLVTMRDKFGIYEIISPSRKGDVHTQSRNARGIEELQTVEELKDKYVIDKARYESIRNEFTTIQHKSIPFIQVVQYPEQSGKKEGPFRTLMVLGALAGSLFLGLFLAILVENSASFSSLINKK